MTKSIERLNEMELLYKEVKKDNKELKKFLKFFKMMDKNSAKLAKYYHNNLLKDIEKTEIINEITNQDSIYEELVDQDVSIRKLIKLCADYINK